MGDNIQLRNEHLLQFYVSMLTLNMEFVRHHENQRSSATTIFCTLAVLLLSVSAIFWEQIYIVPAASGLIAIGIGGFFLNMKLFERSAFHLNLASAYRQSAEMLLEGPARQALMNKPRSDESIQGEKLLALPQYVEDALRHGYGFERAGRNLKGKKTINFVSKGADIHEKGIRSAEQLNPAAPFQWVDPIHNRFSVFAGIHAARLDLYRIWLYIFCAFMVLGVAALISAALGLTIEVPKQ